MAIQCVWMAIMKSVRRCPTLPQGLPCSTIGAESLSFRVRNVTGRFPLAIAAVTRGDTHTPSGIVAKSWGYTSCVYSISIHPCGGVNGRPFSGNHKVDANNPKPLLPAFTTV